MQLIHFLIVIVSLSCGSLPDADFGLTLPAFATAGMVGIWCLLCQSSGWLIASQVRTDQLKPLVGAHWLERQLEFFRWLSLGVVVLCLGGFGVARTLDSVPVVADSMFLQSLILLTPGLVMIVATWSAEHTYGVRLGYTAAGFRNHIASIWLTFRSGLAWLVAPVLLLLGCTDLVSLLPISDSAASAITLVMILGFVILGLPMLIRRLFKTEPIEPTMEAWICEVMSAAKIDGIQPVRWNTGNQAFNAMVAGFVAKYRTLLVSDRLLDELPRDQIAMVVLHEAAHLRRRHVPLRMLAILPAWGAGILVSQIAGDTTWAVPLGSVAGILFTMLILRIASYRSEYDADVQACKMAIQISKQVDFVPASYEQASEVLSAALMRVTFDHPAARKASWLHPGVSDRVAWMRRQREVPINSTTSAGTIANPA